MKEAFAMKHGELSKVLALLWAFICIVYAAPALAQPITVTTSADESDFPWTDCPPPGNDDCSLREAITVANSNGAPGDVIVFDSSLDGATITLNPGLGGLSIGNEPNTTIDATGIAITINANGIDFPLSLNSANITIRGSITITNAGAGGAAVVLNPGADGSSLVGITVSYNAGVGISIGNVNNVVLDRVTVDKNNVGISIWDSSALLITIQNSVVRKNTGTGVYINGSFTTIDRCRVENNGTGGITVDSGGTFTTVNLTTIQDNIGGSGIYSKAKITVTGSTIIRNNPGGISLDVGADNSLIAASTISNNIGGSGIYSKAKITVTGSTIIWNNPGGISLDVGANNSLILGSDISHNRGGSGIFLNGVSDITIGPNNTISSNFAEGVNVRDSSSVSIANSTISYNGQNGLSSGVFIVGTSSDISVGPYNLIENNGGNGITVIEDFNTDNAPTTIRVFSNTVRGNGSIDGDGVGIQIAGAVSFVDIGGNEIYENVAQGILVERTPAGSNGPRNINIVSWNGALPNYIYSNGQEGILIRDLGTQNNVVRGNWIGVDPSDNPAPNGNSGVSLFGGTTRNTIEANTIRYNQYQDVLISGTGTSDNTVQNNRIWGGAYFISPVGYNNAGVVINNGATNNRVEGNDIAYHVFDGVQVVGLGTDDNVIGGNQVYANSRGVVVINDYPDASPPDPDAPPFDLQTDSSTDLGPANTLIDSNDILYNNNDGILVRRDGGGTVIRSNDISNNQADGIRLVGASPSIEKNIIIGNAQNGIQALVFFGEDDSPATENDDVLSQPTIQYNFIASNGAWGVLAIDTPLGTKVDVNRDNFWPDPSGKPSPNALGRIRQDWYGYVRVEDTGGNPVTGLTIVIRENNPPCTGTYTSAVAVSDRNYGPPGFTINSARSYFQIAQAFVDNRGNFQDCTPHYVYVQSDPSINANYSYNGDFPDPPGEPGGAIESPTGSGVDRYQFARLIRPLAEQANLEISKADSPDPVTVGDNLTYTITVTNLGPDAATNVVVTDTLPSGVTFVSASPGCVHSAGVVTCNLGNIPAGDSVTITIVVTVTAPGTISNTATVTSDTLDPNTANNSDAEPTEVSEGPIGGDPPIWGSIMVFPSPEVHYGRGPNQDLNRNMRLDDCVLRYKDLQTGRIVDTKVFVSCTPKDLDIYEQTIVFVDDEKYLGMYDLGTGAVRRTLYKAAHPAIWGRTVVFESDGQIALWNIDADRVEMISSGSQPTIWEDLVVFVGSSGTLWLYDLRQRQLRDTGVRGDQPVIYEKIVAFTALDASGRPLIRYYDVATQTVRDTGAVGSHSAVFGRFIVFQTDEAALGLDLTGDGDRLDTVIRYYDLEAGQVFNTGQLGFEPDIYEDLITFWVFEPRVQQDLNGDGDREDPIVQVYRIREGGSALPLRVTGLRVEREARALRFRALGEGIEAIRVQIYDLQGREVYATQFVPGSQLVWRLQSTDGHPVANGVYLAVISVKGADAIYRSAVQKIVVLR
jgi:uncharacterized repeat protein (TIGR01451 family)